VQKLGIAGHRVLDPSASAFVASASSVLIAVARRAGEVAAVSALAEGADTLFAEAALAAGAHVEVVRPFAAYERDFPTHAAQRRYRALVEAAATETRLPFAARSTQAYEAAMRRVVDVCDVLVAAWDGTPPRGTGGTADAVRYAERVGRRVVHLDVVAHRVLVRGDAE
jgi:hypothetical protein